MPQIIVLPHQELCPEGVVIEVDEGVSVCNALLENDVEIEHACEMSMHVPLAIYMFVKALTI
jgi:2Fe-2S ferredoxin